MIPKTTLKKLIEQRLKDAETLLNNRCYYTSIYLSGYAVELALKHEICKIYNFKQGFPENHIEFTASYNNVNYSYSKKKRLLPSITKLKEIKNHDLVTLLKYSGAKSRVDQNCINEWGKIITWNPEIRYRILTIRKNLALINLTEVKKIVKIILRK